MQCHGVNLAMDGQARKDLIAGELDGVQYREAIELRLILWCEVWTRCLQSISAGAGVYKDGDCAVVGPAGKVFDCVIQRGAMGIFKSLGREGYAAAISTRVRREVERYIGSLCDVEERLHGGDVVRFAGQRTHDASDAGREIYRLSILPRRCRNRTAARLRHLLRPLPEGLIHHFSGDGVKKFCDSDHGGKSEDISHEVSREERYPRADLRESKISGDEGGGRIGKAGVTQDCGSVW